MILNIIDAEPGEVFCNLVTRGKRQLAYHGMSFGYLKHNDMMVSFSVDSNVEDICTIYDMKRTIERMQNGVV